MSIICVFYLILCGDLKEVKYGTNVFRGPVYGQAYVHPDHSVFLLDPDDCAVRVFDQYGAQIHAIGGKGEGPGLFLRPSGIEVFENSLYVFDAMGSRVQVFKLNGSWIESIKVPRPATTLGLTAKRLREGWVFTTPAGALVRSDRAFQEYQTLFGIFDPEDASTWRGSGPRVFGRGRTLLALNPLRDRLYVFHSGSQKEILVYNTQTNSYEQPISLNIPSINFDEDEANAYLERMKDALPLDRRLPEYQVAAHYPLVSYMHVNPDGILHVERGGPRGEMPKPLFFRQDGTEKREGNPQFRGSRYIGKVGDWAYLAYPVDDEIVIHRMPHDRVSHIQSLPPE